MPRFRRNLWLLLAQNVAMFLGIAVQALVLNLYLVALGYREDFVGLVAFVQTAAIGLGAMPASWLSPRVGARRVLIGATLALGSSFAMMASFEQPYLLLAAAAVSGVAMAHVFVPSAPYLADNSSPEQRRAAFAANFAALSVASMAGSALGGIVPGAVGGEPMLGYRAALLAGSALSALGCLPLLFADDTRLEGSMAPAPGRPQSPSAGAPVPSRRRSQRRDLIAMAAATVLLSSSTALVVAFFNVFLRDVVATPTGQIGSVFAAASVAMAPGSLVGPALSRRWGAIPTIVVPRLLSAPLILLLAVLPSTLLVCGTIYALRSMLVSISQPLDNAFAMELVGPRDRARVSALRTMSWNGGWAVASGLGGFAILSFGYPAVFAAAAILTLGSVAVLWGSFRDR